MSFPTGYTIPKREFCNPKPSDSAYARKKSHVHKTHGTNIIRGTTQFPVLLPQHSFISKCGRHREQTPHSA